MMRYNLVLMSVLAALMISAVSLQAQQYQWHFLSPDDAIQVVRDLEHVPDLAMQVIDAPSANSGPPDTRLGYVLRSGNYKYWICSNTPSLYYRRDITFRTNGFYGQPYDTNILASQAMSQQAAQAIATNFLHAHYPEPDILTREYVEMHYGMKRTAHDTDFIQSYVFHFYQDCGNGVRGPSFSRIEVDSVRGQVVAYSCSYFPILISPKPLVTNDQLMSAAINGMSLETPEPHAIEAIDVTQPDAFGQEHLCCRLTVHSKNEEYVIKVDCITGQVINWDTRLGIVKPTMGVDGKPSLHPFHLAKPVSKPYSKLKFCWGASEVILSYPPFSSTVNRISMLPISHRGLDTLSWSMMRPESRQH